MKNCLFFLLLACIFISSGCESVDKSRRIKYVEDNQNLTEEQKYLILQGDLWVGMTPEQVVAVLGSPYNVQKDILDKKEVWSYMYKDQFTTHRQYKFDRVLRLEFAEGRLANWRED